MGLGHGFGHRREREVPAKPFLSRLFAARARIGRRLGLLPIVCASLCMTVSNPARCDESCKSRPDSVDGRVVRVDPDAVPETVPLSVTCLDRGNSSRQFRDAAASALPLDKLRPEDRKRVEHVIRTQSLFRRLPVYSFPADARVYTYFSQHPVMTVGIWRAMGISQFQVHRAAPDYYEASSGDGSAGVVEVLYRDDNQQLVFCHGEYKSPLLVRPIRAAAIMFLRANFQQDDQGDVTATHQLDLFVSFPSITVEAVAKVISPISNMIADRNFHEVTLFVRLMAMAMSNQPGWIEQLIDRVEGVPEADKTELRKITADVYITARRKAGSEDEPEPGVLQSKNETSDQTAEREPSIAVAGNPSDSDGSVR